MDGYIYGSIGQCIGYRRGTELFNWEDQKIFDVDVSGNLISPLTKKIEGHLQPFHPAIPHEKSLDHFFRR